MVEQVVYSLTVLGHPAFQLIGSKIFETKYVCSLQPEGNKLFNDLLVVKFVIVVAPVEVCCKYLLPQSTVLRLLQERHDTRVVQSEYPFSGILSIIICPFGGYLK
ncbi:hypothetical protein SDC9_56649 [bioreactor metagenome]|uniref:Uncharacterized protein n=1 Tax=bioreactor metagenome TaxID=1076179 RepID=A0A644X2F2_9ZZZZ